MNNIDIINKHITPNIQLKLKSDNGTDDVISLKPFTNGERILFSSFCKKFERLKTIKDKLSNEYIALDKEVAIELFDLFSCVLRRSLGEIDNEKLENFILTNFNNLFGIIGDLLPKSKRSNELTLIKKRFGNKNESVEKE